MKGRKKEGDGMDTGKVRLEEKWKENDGINEEVKEGKKKKGGTKMEWREEN